MQLGAINWTAGKLRNLGITDRVPTLTAQTHPRSSRSHHRKKRMTPAHRSPSPTPKRTNPIHLMQPSHLPQGNTHTLMAVALPGTSTTVQQQEQAHPTPLPNPSSRPLPLLTQYRVTTPQPASHTYSHSDPNLRRPRYQPKVILNRIHTPSSPFTSPPSENEPDDCQMPPSLFKPTHERHPLTTPPPLRELTQHIL